MTVHEFIESIWENDIDTPSPISLEEATESVAFWNMEAQKDPRDDETYWNFLNDLTPEIFMEIWNDLCCG